MNYYDKNTQLFTEQTVNLNMNIFYDKFLGPLKSQQKILDIGCGSGRDLKYFKSKGHIPTGIDPSIEMVKMSRQVSNCEVIHSKIQDLDCNIKYDAIWACASLLHIPHKEMYLTFNKLSNILKHQGIIYCSFKYGTDQREKQGRIFSDYTEDLFMQFIKSVKSFSLLEIWKTKDVRPERDEHWLNILLQKV